MNNIVVLAAVFFLAPGAYAEGLNLNSTGLDGLDPARMASGAGLLPNPAQPAAPKCGHVSGEITKLHLMAATAGSQLHTYAETEAEFIEFTAMWAPILDKFGLKVTGSEYSHKLGVLKYESPDGRVIRAFLAERLQYNALDPAEVSKLEHELLEPLEQARLTPIASFSIKNYAFRPTINIYYLTRPNENPDHETRLRQLITGGEIDYDLLAGSVRLVKEDTPYSMVYIGKELGFKSKWAATEEALAAKVAEYRKFLAENGKEFINSRTFRLDTPQVSGDITVNYMANIYFFQ